jgi:ACR3 family arsenite efflux pump ArsB
MKKVFKWISNKLEKKLNLIIVFSFGIFCIYIPVKQQIDFTLVQNIFVLVGIGFIIGIFSRVIDKIEKK